MCDEDDVERGYHVYIHRDRANQTPFYVGKGKRSRGHDLENRSSYWHEKVKSLTDGVDVEIVKDDLTEEEAFDLEREMIAKYGRVSEGDGPLVNMTGGGSLDFGESVAEIRFVLPPERAKEMEEDYENRKYRKLKGDERSTFARNIKKKMDELYARYDDLVIEDEETDYEFDLESVLWQVGQLATDYANRKVSSKDFGFRLEDLMEDIESEVEDALEDQENEKREMVKIGQECESFLKSKVASIKESENPE